MDWERIIDAANGRPQSLAWIVDRSDADGAALATLLLLEETPHPAATLVVGATWRGRSAQPIHAALAPHVAPTLAAWRADPHWPERAIGDQTRWRLTWGVAVMSGALRDDPAALRDAAAMVLRDGDVDAIVWLLAALGADGWAALEADRRAALLQKAPADALGLVWGALDDAQRAATAQRAEGRSSDAARLIGAIGAAAWRATDPALRETLMNAVLRDPWWIAATAPAWPGMPDDERDVLARAVIMTPFLDAAFHLLEALGGVGRATLTVKQRAALEQSAMDHPDAWRVLAWRAADAGRDALTAEERSAVLAAAERSPWDVAVLLRDIGVAGWTALRADEQARLAAMVRCTPDAFFRCPPALWGALAGAALPSATRIPAHVLASWRAEDAESDLGALPPTHQTLVLALAPWRWKDATAGASRMQRLCVAWGAMTDDERVALATEAPSLPAVVAASARLAGGAPAARAVVGETVARIVTATGGAAAKRAVGAMLRTPARWRSWMIAFAPTDDDPPDAWAAWRRAARRGVVPDSALCARLAAKERAAGPTRRGLRRARR